MAPWAHLASMHHAPALLWAQCDAARHQRWPSRGGSTSMPLEAACSQLLPKAGHQVVAVLVPALLAALQEGAWVRGLLHADAMSHGQPAPAAGCWPWLGVPSCTLGADEGSVTVPALLGKPVHLGCRTAGMHQLCTACAVLGLQASLAGAKLSSTPSHLECGGINEVAAQSAGLGSQRLQQHANRHAAGEGVWVDQQVWPAGSGDRGCRLLPMRRPTSRKSSTLQLLLVG